MESDYEKYRGQCKEMAEEAAVKDPSLTVVRGHYHCPIWGKQPHWWCVGDDGAVVDPSKDQFPSKGLFDYEPFNGKVNCSECGKEMDEKDARYDSNYVFCSYECNGKFVGAF